MSAAAPPILWTPSAERVERAWLTRYERWLEARLGRTFAGYAELQRWSVDELDAFWRSIWDYFDVQADGSPERVLGRREMPGAEWFPDVSLNYAEHVFRGKADDEVAIRHAGEGRALAQMTWGELRTLTARIAAGLRAQGVGRGDRVVAYLPNVPEAIAAMLATAAIGATWSSCSPDFGARSVVDRFAQIEPTVLLAVDGYRYNGRAFDRREVVAGLIRELPSLRAAVLLPYLDADATLDGTVAWADFLAADGAGAADGDAPELTFDRVPFAHPLWVLYSSGTTGLPKPIVQGHGGILLEQLKKQHLHLDAHAEDRVFWFTTTGWMMWNFLLGVLLTPASVVLYDGSPAEPDMDVLWQLAADAGVTVFGTSASYIAQCMKDGVEPTAGGRDLSRLHAVGSTGSPLAPEGFQWVADQLGSDTWLFSTSGGTDVCTAFVGGVPTLPVYRGELQGPSLGCKVESWDPDGRPLTGAVGELVIAQPMPSMPLFLWGDGAPSSKSLVGSRYRDSYFDMFPGIWRHGDWIELTERGTAIISGRSDATINRGGIRMGTAEIYRAVLALDEILDALVVDVDGWMPLFVVLREGAQLDDDLTKRIARRVREDCSPRHVPNEVHAVPGIPRTLSGKALEIPVKRILQGADPAKAASRGSLRDPAALDWFADFAAQRSAAAKRSASA